jgi:hypothetical protein
MTSSISRLFFDEAIMEVMASLDKPWEDLHHHTSFFLDLEMLEDEITNLVATNNVQWYQSPIMIHDVFSKGNLENIFPEARCRGTHPDMH